MLEWITAIGIICCICLFTNCIQTGRMNKIDATQLTPSYNTGLIQRIKKLEKEINVISSGRNFHIIKRKWELLQYIQFTELPKLREEFGRSLDTVIECPEVGDHRLRNIVHSKYLGVANVRSLILDEYDNNIQQIIDNLKVVAGTEYSERLFELVRNDSNKWNDYVMGF